MKIDNLIYKDSIQNFTINLLNIKTDSLVSYLNVMRELNSNIVANDSLNSITIENLKKERDSVIEKLNTTYQEEIKQEIEAFNFFVN